jgi:hypothetical protein
MQEAWFVFDERSLREAAGNPEGAMTVELPAVDRLEQLPDPKGILEQLLREASGLRGRRLAKFRLGPAKHRLAELIYDFAPLRALPAFCALEEEVISVVRQQGWGSRAAPESPDP